MTGAGLFIVLGFCVLQYLALPETHHFVLHKNDFDVHQDIIADVQENYAMLVIGKVEGCDWCNVTVNFHDFNTGMLALKEIPTGICYLTKSPIPALDMKLYRSGYSSRNRIFVANEFQATMTKSEVELLAGPRIADFCQDYSVKLMELTRMPSRDVRAASDNGIPAPGCPWSCKNTHAPCHYHCSFCTIRRSLA